MIPELRHKPTDPATAATTPSGPSSVDLYAAAVREVDAKTARQSLSRPACIVCGAESARARLEVVGTHFRVVDCDGCGLGVLDPMPTGEEIAAFYPPSYYGRDGLKFEGAIEWLVRLVAGRQARFLARILPPGGRVLDVGCGRGVTLRRLAKRGFEAHGFEFSPDAADGIDARVQMRIAAGLPQAAYPRAAFDAVIIWHALEHMPNPREVLEEAHALLKPGGVLTVAVPNYSSLQARWAKAAWFHLDLPRHLHHFPVAALQTLVTRCGFVCRNEHHFSLRQNPFGWVQSLLNKRRRLPRNGLYVLLQRRKPGRPPPYTRGVRAQLTIAFVVLMPLAAVISVFAAMLRRGATVHIVAFKP